MRKTILLIVPLLLGGCQTWGPTWSELSGKRITKVEMNRLPVIIERVDDQGAFASHPIKIEPGKRELVLQGPTPARPGGSVLLPYTLVAEPCKRYYINAQFENPITNSWTPVIDYVEEIAGCKVVAKS
jgi:hypothetical protein